MNISPTLEDELALEYEYKFMAMEKTQEFLDSRLESTQAHETGVGNGIIDYLFTTFKENVMHWGEDTITPKRGVKPNYADVLKWLTTLMPLEDTVNKMCLMALSSTLSNTLNAWSNTNAPRSTVSYVSSLIAKSLRDESRLQEFINYLEDHKDDEEYRKAERRLESGIKYRKSDYYRRYFAIQFMNKSNWTGTTFAEDLWGQLATYLVSLLIDSSDFFDRQMVFVKTKEMEAIVPSEKLIATWEKNSSNMVMHAFAVCPMIVPP